MATTEKNSHIHPTAVIDPRADIHPEAEIGPYVIIDGVVKIGRATRVMAHAYLTGWTEIGEDNTIHMGAVVGHEPQDLEYQGAKTYLKIIVGDDNFIMNHAHIAHNCEIGNRIIIAGGALLAGYVQVEDSAFISGNCVVHQFTRIGKLALMRGLTGAGRDIPPFCIMGETQKLSAINQIGLERAGYSKDQIREIRRAFSRLFRRRGNLAKAIKELESQGNLSEEVVYMLDFIKSSQRGVCFGPGGK
jgi:UDP-N-acetylglucosamine acyltransferase